MNDNTVALAAIALASSLSVGFFALLNKLAKSLDDIVKSNHSIVDSNKAIAEATDRVGNEAEKRNSHLADLVIKTSEGVNSLATSNLIDFKKGKK